MHPALSVIFFTTASGAGYGMLFLMGVLSAAGLLPADMVLGIIGLGLALALITAGLLSSTLHLGHPERAWRAVSQWRSSWLAREGVAAIATYVPAALLGLSWVFTGNVTGPWGWLGVITAVMAAVTVYCTAMIYRSLKTIHQWHNAWVTPSYLILGLMTGAVLLNAVTHVVGVPAHALQVAAVLVTLVGWAIKSGYWHYIKTSKALSTPETATAIHAGRVERFEAPHSSANYLMKEMGYQVARGHAHALRLIAHVTAFAIPLALNMGALWTNEMVALIFSLLAALSVTLGIIAERWLFFAEAKHTVMLYYGAESA